MSELMLILLANYRQQVIVGISGLLSLLTGPATGCLIFAYYGSSNINHLAMSILHGFVFVSSLLTFRWPLNKVRKLDNFIMLTYFEDEIYYIRDVNESSHR